MASLQYIASEGAHPKRRKRMHERLRWKACEKEKAEYEFRMGA
jgi:hypothetical protein